MPRPTATRPSRKLVRAAGAALAVLAALGGSAALAKDTGNIYVSSEKDHAITVLDGKTYAVTKTIKTGKRPRDMRLSADRTQLYVIASDSKRMDVIDLAKGAVAGNVPVGEDPEMFDLSPDGKRIVVSNEEGAQLSVIDLATKKKVTAIKVGEEPEGGKFRRRRRGEGDKAGGDKATKHLHRCDPQVPADKPALLSRAKFERKTVQPA